jgi:hypothetical protein
MVSPLNQKIQAGDVLISRFEAYFEKNHAIEERAACPHYQEKSSLRLSTL